MQPANFLEFTSLGSWTRFDQGDFVGINSTLKDDDGNTEEWKWGDTDFSSIGYAYIPNTCFRYWDKDIGTVDQKPCHIHLTFADCNQRGELVQLFAFLNELPLVAATNDMIMVYPSSACWNMDGLIDQTNEGTIDGLYPRSIQQMLCRLKSPSEGSQRGCLTGAITSLAYVSLAMATTLSLLY